MSGLARVASVVALLAIAVWLGGLVALGAVAAPIVFGHVSWPANADAMSLVFRRFDAVAMASAALVLATEAARALGGAPFTRVDHTRAFASLLAAAAAVVEGVHVSPRIAALHAGGAIRGIDAAGIELASLHDLAESLGKAQVVLLAGVVVLQVMAMSLPGGQASGAGEAGGAVRPPSRPVA